MTVSICTTGTFISEAAVTRHLARMLDAPAVLAGYSRLIVDLNRKLHEPSAFIKVSDGIAIPGNLEMTEHEREARVQSFFNPYHEAISRKLAEFRGRGVVPVRSYGATANNMEAIPLFGLVPTSQPFTRVDTSILMTPVSGAAKVAITKGLTHGPTAFQVTVSSSQG